MPPSSKEVIEILDDDSINSQSDGTGSLAEPIQSKSAGKRKIKRQSPPVSIKGYFTDDSDTVPTKPKKRRAKRKSLGKGIKQSGTKNSKDGDDELDLAGIPEYVQERRKEFDANKKRHHESALMLPPDYRGIVFEGSSRLSELEERPKFDENSGVKPCRPYEDIELPQSAGFIPASIAQYLRDYQVAGVKFLHKKFVYQEGGILGDDMGLGKTVQVAAFLAVAFGKTGDERDGKRMREIRYEPQRWYPRILIICPGSLIVNWRNELNRWGWWHIDLYHGSTKDDALDTARAGLLEVMITTYDTYKNSRGKINMVKWDAVIADECHRLKDRYSETTKAMAEVNALCRIGLTGTAIQNNYEELWTLLDWTHPGHFGTQAEWREAISRPLTVGQSHEATAAQLSLARQTAKKLVENLLPRYFLRRMKTLIAHQLPKKTDRVVFCPLTDLQREAYENFLDSAEIDLLRRISETCEHGKTRGWCCGETLPSGQRWSSIVFPSMIVLQKLANHLILMVPNTTDINEKHENELKMLRLCMPRSWETLYQQRDQIRNLVNPEFCGKWKVLKRLLKFWHSNGDKVLVFSHSVRLLRILQHLFTNTSYSVSYLDGSLSYEARQEVVDTFNTDPTQFVFLISTKAGGVGLNITSANKVVIVDPHWNPSYDLQAQDRAYRIGQTRDVEVFRLISLGTIEEIVYARQVYKQQQANIGYTASSERRYFRGVQNEADRKGEIFGLSNIFSYHPDSGLLRDIVNKTNIAEAKAGVNLVDIDMDKAVKDEETLGDIVKKEESKGGAEDGGLSQLADLITSQAKTGQASTKKTAPPKSDAIQAILTSAGVQYTHDNAEVVGSSKFEEQLSRHVAEMAYADTGSEEQSALFEVAEDDQGQEGDEGLHGLYNPPEDVMKRQFCEMSREFGFGSVTEFALVVENWSTEARNNCLDSFYKRRAEMVENGEGNESDSRAKTEEEMDDQTSELDVKKKEEEEAMAEIKSEVESEFDKTRNFGSVQTSTVARREFKIEGTSKRTSIFLSDDDDDDDEEL